MFLSVISYHFGFLHFLYLFLRILHLFIRLLVLILGRHNKSTTLESYVKLDALTKLQGSRKEHFKHNGQVISV